MVSNPHYDYGLLRRALALSLLLHAALLLQPGFDSAASGSHAAQALSAMLRSKLETPPAVSAPTQARRPAPAQASPRDTAVAPAQETSAVEPASAGAAEATGGAVAKSDLDGNAAGLPQAAEPLPGLDFAEAKKSYLFAIAAEARRVKKYPPRAFAAGWTGTAEIRVTVAAGGNAQAPQLHKSSGYTDIDSAALSFVAIALQRTPVPPGLRAGGFEFLLPVSFTIKEQ